MKLSKNLSKIAKKHDKTVSYSLDDAVELVQKFKFVKFDESVDLAINLDVDPRHAEENIRVTTPLPHGTGKLVKVLVLTEGPKEKEAQEAGADFVGNKDFLTKIKNGWTDVDKIVATPDMMAIVGKLGKILGPKGLMPNPKLGTVTKDVKKTIIDIKAGLIEFKADKSGIVHAGIGKKSFSLDKLEENYKNFIDAIIKAKPKGAKGTYLKSIFVSFTMGPSLKIINK